MKNSKRWKDMLIGGAIAATALTLAVPALAATGSRTVRVDYSDIKLVVNGKTVTPRDGNGDVVEPFTIDGTTYLPVRAVGNALDMDVAWNGSTHTVTLTDRTGSSSGGSQSGSSDVISSARAREIALDDAGVKESDARFVRVDLDWEDGRLQYEVEFYSGNKEYDYDINAVTGDILDRDYDIEGYTIPTDGSADYIGKEKAKEIALDDAGVRESEVRFVRVELDWDDGRPEY